MAEEGVIKKHISFQPEIYAVIEEERAESGLPFSTQLNQMLADVSRARRLLLIGDALNASLIDEVEAARRISALAAGDEVA